MNRKYEESGEIVMNGESMFWEDGAAYHRTAVGAKKRPEVLAIGDGGKIVR
jgi:hypothetical protein